VQGIETSIPLHQAIFADPGFRAGDFDTSFMEKFLARYIGERLLATLPPTGLHYRFRIYDSGEINAYSLPGGRVYVSRKLITAVKNEDALAGVVAHEIGHISTHQLAIAFTRNLRIRLGVTQVTDRADIFARVHQFFSTPAKSSEEQGRETNRELVADHVAMYAMVRAGYAPESFSSFLDESMMNKGKTGNWLSDAFGLTHESSQRYRNALKLIDDLPSECKQKQPSSNAAFKAWLDSIVEERVKSVAEGVTGDRPLKLESPLRPALERIRFSPDGRYLLAQDEGGISVVDKEAGKTLFRIDAPDVEAAQFTLDSKNIVFHDKNLRVERWSMATGQRASVKELVVFDGCNQQSRLSPDGKTLVCVSLKAVNGAPSINLRLFDVESGKQFFEKPNYFELYDSGGTYFFSNPLFISAYQFLKIAGPMRLEISPNGKYLLAVKGNHVLAYDLELRQPVELKGKLKGLKQARMTFLGPDQLFVVGDVKDQFHYQAQILSFPDGRLLDKTQVANFQIEGATNGHYLIVHSDKDNLSQILDPVPEKYLVSSKHPSLDVWDQTVVAEDATGGLAVGQIGLPGEKQIALPLGPLPNPRAAVFSPDGKYLALSLKSRAEIWDLETGKKIGLIRPFQSAWMDDADNLYGQFPKIGDFEPSEIKIYVLPHERQGTEQT
jgi:WD40 repeat protein